MDHERGIHTSAAYEQLGHPSSSIYILSLQSIYVSFVHYRQSVAYLQGFETRPSERNVNFQSAPTSDTRASTRNRRKRGFPQPSKGER